MGDSDSNTNSTNNIRRCGQIGEGDEDLITMEDAMNEQIRLMEDASAVLGGSDPVNCSYSKGYVNRQAVYACATCTPNGNAGICLACSDTCHEGHELYELYTKRFFCCDCGNDKFPGLECKLTQNKTGMNARNRYNHNFKGVYCTCRRPYPDPDDSTEDEMIQCIMCEDWYHGRHLKAAVPEEFVEMICHECMSKFPFLWAYYLVNSHDATKITKSSEKEIVDIESCSSTDKGENNMPTEIDNDLSTEEVQKTKDEVEQTSIKLELSPTIPAPSTSTQLDCSTTPDLAVKRLSTSAVECESTPKKMKKDELEHSFGKDENCDQKACLLKSLEKRNSQFREHATFWPPGWRSKLCQCEDCMNMYKDRELEYLIEESDTVQAYEERGNLIVPGTNAEDENEEDILAGLDRVTQIEVARGLQDFKSELASFLQEFAQEGKIVKESDIQEFFERLKQKQHRRSNIPQHNCR